MYSSTCELSFSASKVHRRIYRRDDGVYCYSGAIHPTLEILPLSVSQVETWRVCILHPLARLLRSLIYGPTNDAHRQHSPSGSKTCINVAHVTSVGEIDTDRRPSTTVRGLLCLKSVVPWRSADHSVFSAAGVGWLRVAEQLSRDGKSIERAPSPAFLGLSQFSSRQKAEFVDSAQKITSWQGQVSARHNFTHQPFLLFIAVKPQIPHALADLTRFVRLLWQPLRASAKSRAALTADPYIHLTRLSIPHPFQSS
ncbi:hypothetical protein KCU99_g302, partial [Aureobasidium melanogenum]